MKSEAADRRTANVLEVEASVLHRVASSDVIASDRRGERFVERESESRQTRRPIKNAFTQCPVDSRLRCHLLVR